MEVSSHHFATYPNLFVFDTDCLTLLMRGNHAIDRKLKGYLFSADFHRRQFLGLDFLSPWYRQRYASDMNR